MPLDQNPQKSSDLFWVHWYFNVCAQIFCSPNATMTYELHTKLKVLLFFQNPHTIFAHILECSHYYSETFPSSFESYSQTYTFSGSIKLTMFIIIFTQFYSWFHIGRHLIENIKKYSWFKIGRHLIKFINQQDIKLKFELLMSINEISTKKNLITIRNVPGLLQLQL